MSSAADLTAAVVSMRAARRLPDALMDGTEAMRALREVYLPREVAESPAAYDVRLRRSFLFPGYAKAIRDMAGKVFAKPIGVGDDVQGSLRAAMENIDLAGRNLDTFAHGVFVDALNSGVSYILVDMDRAPVDDTGAPVTLSRAQAAEMQRRPWAVHIRAAQVLGWRTETVNGIERLSQFRFIEQVTEPDGDFGEREVEQVRALMRDGGAVVWRSYRKDNRGAWLVYDEGDVTIGEIAVCPIYTNRTGFMAGKPPLMQLAEVNLAHWQSQSDQRNILHMARVPILFGSGLGERDELVVGAGVMIRAESPDAKLAFVEHSGRAIDAGRQDLKDLEFQMQTLGLELLVPRPSSDTATGAAIDQARMNTPLAMMARSLQDGLEQMLGYMALYEGLPRDTGGGSLVVNTDFGVSLGSAADGAVLTEAVKQRIISREQWIREMKRRSVLSEDVDPENEAALALDEGFADEMTDQTA